MTEKACGVRSGRSVGLGVLTFIGLDQETEIGEEVGLWGLKDYLNCNPRAGKADVLVCMKMAPMGP